LKVICIKSHTVPLDDKGHFATYIAGREYDVAEPDMTRFRAAGGSSGGEKAEGAKGRKGDGGKKKLSIKN
jgi:hypothetical protein